MIQQSLKDPSLLKILLFQSHSDEHNRNHDQRTNTYPTESAH